MAAEIRPASAPASGTGAARWGMWAAFAALVVVSFGFILPVNAPQNMVAYGTDTFSARDFVRAGLALTMAGYVLVLILGATWWPWLGYV